MTLQNPFHSDCSAYHLQHNIGHTNYGVIEQVAGFMPQLQYIVDNATALIGRDIILRYNDTTKFIEWQYAGEALWHPLLDTSELVTGIHIDEYYNLVSELPQPGNINSIAFVQETGHIYYYKNGVWLDCGPLLPPINDATTIQIEAGEAIGGHRAVVLYSNKAFYATNTNPSHAHAISGISAGAANIGSNVVIKRDSIVIEPSWNWVEKQPIFLGSNGSLTQTPPVNPAAFSCIIGWAITQTSMFVQIQSPIFL